MARSTREELELASTFLKKQGEHDYAHAVDAVLAPGGWTLLRGSAGSSAGSEKSNLPVTTTQDVKAALKAAASDMGVSLSAVAADGYRAVLDGTWEPPRVKPKRSTAASPLNASTMSVLNLRVLDSLRQEVRKQLPALSAKAGYRVSEASIVLPFLMDELGVQDPRGQDTFGTMVGQRLRDHLMQEAERQQVTLHSVLQEGIREVEAGRVPEFKRAAKNTRPDEGARVRLTIPVDTALLTKLNEIAPQLSDSLDRKIYPGTLALTLLKEKLGEPE